MKKIFLFILLMVLFFPNYVRANSYTPDQLATYIKQTEYYDFMNNSEDYSWNVTYDNASKKLKSSYKGTNEDNGDTVIEFYLTYDEETKSLEYLGNEDIEKNFSENIHLGFIVYSLGEMFGYDTNDIKELMNGEDIEYYILDEDGIWIDYEELNDYVLSDGTKITGRLITKLKISLENGFGNLEAKKDPIDPDNIQDSSNGSTTKENIQNPKTLDLNVSIIILGIISCIILILFGTKKLRKN